ncbi:endonuclease V [Actinokineospora pegani]|uniref:endonuclease V n=1 Tax=Actinokineospora pegani TaxID=2654637 RepID=UPI0012EAC72D|nr:endonuclease V [Actinokineospora pegani]
MRSPLTPEEAIAEQQALAPQVNEHPPPHFTPRTAAGLDVAYAGETGHLVAAATVIDLDTLTLIDSAVVEGHTDFPYIPGLFAYRELPSLLKALTLLTTTPDVLVCDAQGKAHPRRFGLACHLGLTTGIPTLGAGKTPMGPYTPPAPTRGSWTPLADDDEEVGRALRTQDNVKPLFISIGHNLNLATATDLVLRLTPTYRQPETTRTADHLCRQALKFHTMG